MRVTMLLAGTAAAALAAAPSMAQTDITQQGADEIRQVLVDFVDSTFADLDVQVNLAGEIAVVPAGDVYAATIPEMTISVEGNRVIADPIDMALIPLENGWYDASWTLPGRVAIEDGSDVGFITIGSQSSDGVFAPAFESFMSIDSVLERIEVVPPPDDDGTLTLARFSLVGDSEPLGQDRYNGDFAAVLEDLDFAAGGGREAFRIGELSFDWIVEDLDLPAFYRFHQSVEALMEQVEADTAKGQPPASVFDQASSLLAMTPALLDGFAVEYRVEDLMFADGMQMVDVASGSFAISLDGLRGDSSVFGIAFDSGAVQLDPAPPEARFFPTETRVDVSLVDLPNEQLLGIVSQFLTSAGQMGPDAAAMMAGLSLQQAVMAGGSTVQIEEIIVVTETAALELNGQVVPDQTAAFGLVADATMIISGLPDLIADMQATLGPDAQRPVQALTVLQTMGAPTASDSGIDVRTYDFEVLPTGQVLMNGADVAPLIAVLQ